MGGKGAVLALRIISDASGAAKGFQEAEGRVAGLESKLSRATPAALAVGGAIVFAASQAYDAAAKLEQSSGAVESVFGAQAAAIKGYAEDAAQAVGLSTNSYQELASVLGAQLGGMGYAGKELTTQTDALIRTGADLAATFGGSTSDAVSALSSLMRGERDPIERYGIALSQAAVDAQVAAMGLDTSTPAAKRAADAQATLALVAEQSAAAQGAFAREADTAAGQTQRAQAEFENAAASLGEVLLPVVAEGARKLSELAGFLVENKNVVIPLVGVIGGLAAAVVAVNAALSVYRAIAVVATAAQWLWNIALSANPIGLIVLAIAAVVAAVVLAYNKFEWFRAGVEFIGKAIMGYINLWIDAIKWVIDKLSFVGKGIGLVADLFGAGGTVTVAGGGMAGMYGAAGAVAAPAGLYGAPMAALAGGGPSSGQGSGGGTTTVNVTVHDAIDPVSTGRTLEKILRQYAAATGSQVTLTIGGKR